DTLRKTQIFYKKTTPVVTFQFIPCLSLKIKNLYYEEEIQYFFAYNNIQFFNFLFTVWTGFRPTTCLSQCRRFWSICYRRPWWRSLPCYQSKRFRIRFIS